MCIAQLLYRVCILGFYTEFLYRVRHYRLLSKQLEASGAQPHAAS